MPVDFLAAFSGGICVLFSLLAQELIPEVLWVLTKESTRGFRIEYQAGYDRYGCTRAENVYVDKCDTLVYDTGVCERR